LRVLRGNPGKRRMLPEPEPTIEPTCPDAMQNPLIAISRRAAEHMLKFASEFGMTPVARSRLAARVGFQPPRPGKFDGLLA
jgi:hypothetical protein